MCQDCSSCVGSMFCFPSSGCAAAGCLTTACQAVMNATAWCSQCLGEASCYGCGTCLTQGWTSGSCGACADCPTECWPHGKQSENDPIMVASGFGIVVIGTPRACSSMTHPTTTQLPSFLTGMVIAMDVSLLLAAVNLTYSFIWGHRRNLDVAIVAKMRMNVALVLVHGFFSTLSIILFAAFNWTFWLATALKNVSFFMVISFLILRWVGLLSTYTR